MINKKEIAFFILFVLWLFSIPASYGSSEKKFIYNTLQKGNNSQLIPIHIKPFEDIIDSRIGNLVNGMNGNNYLDHVYNNEIKSLGFTRYRFGLNHGDWNSVDWGIDEFKIYNEDKIFLEDMARSGMKLTCTLSFWDINNHSDGIWHTTESRFKTADDIKKYLEYITFIVENYKGVFTYYEIWNEPSRSDSPIQRIDPEDYIEVVKKAVPLIKSIDKKAKVIIGATTDLYSSEGYNWLFSILSHEILPIVDGISWHGLGECSPQYDLFKKYYYNYPKIVQDIMETAHKKGFKGEFFSDELRWGTPKNHNADKQEFMYTEKTSAKYFARQIIMHLGMNINVTIAMDMSDPNACNAAVIKNICSVLDSVKPAILPARIYCNEKKIKCFSFKAPNGDFIIALYNDNVALDEYKGVLVDIHIPGIRANSIIGIDILNNTEQKLEARYDNDYLQVDNLIIKDYPILLKISDEYTKKYEKILNNERSITKKYINSMCMNGGLNPILGLDDYFKPYRNLQHNIRYVEKLFENCIREQVDVEVNAGEKIFFEAYSIPTGDYLLYMYKKGNNNSLFTDIIIKNVKASKVSVVDLLNRNEYKIGFHQLGANVKIHHSIKSDNFVILKIYLEDPASRIAVFEDHNIEKAVRKQLNNFEDDILLKDLESIEYLKIRDTGVSSLKGIENVTNLKYLDAAMNKIVDLSPLSELTKLEELQLWNNKIVDVNPLKKLVNLRILWIGTNEIVDITPLKELIKLEELGIWSCQIEELGIVSELVNLKILDIRYNSIIDYSPLKNFKGELIK